MKATTIIAAMTAILEAPGYPLLKYYKMDFAADKLQVQNTWHPAMRMLWIVRESGTHLGTLGVHPRINESLRVVIDRHLFDKTTDKMDCFLVTAQGIAKLTAQQALAELKQLDYIVTGNEIMDKHENCLASFQIDLCDRQGKLLGDVDFTTTHQNLQEHPNHCIALAQIAQCEVINAWQSLQASARRVTLNGVHLQPRAGSEADTDEKAMT